MRYTAVTSEPYIHNVIRRGEYRRSLTATISTNNQMIASVFENLNKICRYPLLVPLIVVRASVKFWEIVFGSESGDSPHISNLSMLFRANAR